MQQSLNRLAVVIVIICLLFSSTACASDNQQMQMGRTVSKKSKVLVVRNRGTPIKEIEIARPKITKRVKRVYKGAHRKASINHPFRNYRNLYCRNRMTSAQKAAYDALDQVCLDFILKKIDAQFDAKHSLYYIPTGANVAIARNEFMPVFIAFKMANPQYYFLNNAYFVYLDSTGGYMMNLCVYSKFHDGASRYAVSRKFIGKINTLARMVKSKVAGKDSVTALKYVHNFIAYNCTYDDEMAAKVNTDKYCSQSAWSMIANKKGVCVGYASLYALLCTKIGLNVVQITSKTHCWNKALVGGTWYNIDVTFDDNITEQLKRHTTDQTFFCINDAGFKSVSSKNGVLSEHTPNSYWSSFGL